MTAWWGESSSLRVKKSHMCQETNFVVVVVSTVISGLNTYILDDCFKRQNIATVGGKEIGTGFLHTLLILTLIIHVVFGFCSSCLIMTGLRNE